DSGGYVHVPEGINEAQLRAIMELKNEKRGRIIEFAEEFGLEYFSGEKPWGVKGEVALPCATENEIDENDAANLLENGIRYIAEGANMPSTGEAQEVFSKNGIKFGPAKAANAGGVAVSGLEMAQNAQHSTWSREEVDEKLKLIMQKIHSEALKEGKGDYAKGANIAGFKRVAKAMRSQGIV
ncbi:MAG: glutamate dehydrogenase, partial [Candidatus Dojkabacteria bacterium]